MKPRVGEFFWLVMTPPVCCAIIVVSTMTLLTVCTGDASHKKRASISEYQRAVVALRCGLVYLERERR